MAAIENILVVVDPGAQRQPALERAAWLAKRSGATLELFICDYDQYFGCEHLYDSESLVNARGQLIARHARHLRDQARRLAEQGIEVSVDARLDHPLHEAIVRKVQDAGSDIVFKDTHYHAPLGRALFSNTDWSLLRSCPVPLWLVKAQPMPGRPRIMAAVDPLHEHDKFAELDHRMLEAAGALRSAIDGELHLVHVYEIAPALAKSTATPISMPLRDIAEALKKQHSDAVFDLADAHALERGAVHICQGRTQQVLIRFMRQMNADVVVLGAVSRSALHREVLGSTAEQVLDHFPCDMLIVKPAGVAAAARSVRSNERSHTRGGAHD
ncbi:MAG: universal stress protein [Nitrococcus sp.]|nr:universal stress protein [Nitrococcus sp.]